MTDYCIQPALDAKTQRDFLRLPQKLYSGAFAMQNPEQERELLQNRHVLSGYFSFFGFVCYCNSRPVARWALSIPPQENTCYLGFFECLPEHEACAPQLFAHARAFARSQNMERICGPVNGSFWLGYRMKVDHFTEPPFFSEPYNLPSYPKLWEDNGFSVCGRYLTNISNRVETGSKANSRYQNRMQQFTKQGYRICSPSKKEFSALLHEVYHLIMPLYTDFPVFQKLKQDDFIAAYSSLGAILDYSLTQIAYYKDKPVAFFIVTPNYGNSLRRQNFRALPGYLYKKYFSKQFIVLYMGVLPQHHGLGTAFLHKFSQQIGRTKSTAIGSMIQEGKVSAGYGKSMVTSRNHYVLYECLL